MSVFFIYRLEVTIQTRRAKANWMTHLFAMTKLIIQIKRTGHSDVEINREHISKNTANTVQFIRSHLNRVCLKIDYYLQHFQVQNM